MKWLLKNLFNRTPKRIYSKPVAQIGSEFLNAESLTPEVEEYLISQGKYYNQNAKDQNRIIEDRDHIWHPNIAAAEPIINKGMQDAYRYKTSKQYVDMLRNLGFGDEDMQLLLYNRNWQRPPKIVFDNLDTAAGTYQNSKNLITYDSWYGTPGGLKYLPRTAFHEPLHFFRIGNTNLVNIPEVIKFLEEETHTINSPEYNTWNAVHPISDRIKKFQKSQMQGLLKDDASEYISDPDEFYVHGLTRGRELGISPFQTYPGDKLVKDIVKPKDYTLGKALTDKRDPETLQRLWKLLTGQLAPAVVPFGVGVTLTGAINKYLTNEQRGEEVQ